MTERASVAARVAGIVVALGYLLGIVDGPVLGAVGGLALITLGRGLLTPRSTYLLGIGAFAVLAGASGVIALRWATLDLADLRGLHGVLGPSLAVQPPLMAAACAAAALCGLVATALWLAEPGPTGRGVVWGGEAAAAGLFMGTLSVGRDVTGVIDLAWWAVALVVTAAAAVAGARFLPARVRLMFLLLGASGLLVLAAAVTVGASA